jgi:hypothetical protein
LNFEQKNQKAASGRATRGFFFQASDPGFRFQPQLFAFAAAVDNRGLPIANMLSGIKSQLKFWRLRLV